MYGGIGNDWLDVNVWSREGQLDNATGFGLLDPDGYNMPWHLTVAHIHGGEGNDTLTAGYGGDYVYGENGNDSIIDVAQKVSGTKDHLYGGLGNDAIEGRDGPDDIDGGAGTDTIVGGTGKDHIYANDGEADQVACGGQGDILYYDAGKDTVFSC